MTNKVDRVSYVRSAQRNIQSDLGSDNVDKEDRESGEDNEDEEGLILEGQ